MSSKRRAIVVAFVGALAGSVASAGDPASRLELASPPGTSRELLESLLDDDLEAGTAGAFPTALLEALCERDPDRFGRDPDETYERFGFLRLKDHARPVGITEVEKLGVRLRNYNCLACHSGEEDGALVVGAPNRTVDFVAFYEQVFGTAREIVRGARCHTTAVLELTGDARAFKRRRGEKLAPGDSQALALFLIALASAEDRKRDSGYGPGRTVVTASYRVVRFHMSPGPYAPVKPPDLFGVAARSGLLWTGNEKYAAGYSPEERIARNGLLVPWVQLEPLTRKPAPDDAIVARLDHHRRMAKLLARSVPPPAPSPPESRRTMHARGRALFEETCARCHGRYDQVERSGKLETRVLDYEEKLVELDEIGTDPAYEESNSYDFAARVAETPIGKLYARIPPEHTYVARPLLGVRLRFPYLHNASVPSLRALLEKPSDRPKKFCVGRDASIDREACGYSSEPAPGSRVQVRETARAGDRATGHDYGTDLREEDKRALIEYLKTL